MNKKIVENKNLAQSLIDVSGGKMSLHEFIKIFLESELIVPSAVETQEGDFIVPLFFKKEGQSMLSVFASPFFLEMYKNNVKKCFIMKGKEVLMRLPPNVGLVINPGCSEGFDVSPAGAQDIVKDFLTDDKK